MLPPVSRFAVGMDRAGVTTPSAHDALGSCESVKRRCKSILKCCLHVTHVSIELFAVNGKVILVNLLSVPPPQKKI